MATKMFTATSSKCDSPITSAEAKYVTDILSSMANGDPITSYPMSSGGFHCGVTTATTPTLTPTTLANIEQTFIELQSVPVTRPSHDPHTQSGFVPPIVDPTPPHTRDTSSRDSYECSDTSDSDWMPSVKRARMADGSMAPYTMQPSSTPGRKSRRSKDEKLSPEEEERRRVRRERNKVAAAKCRQRRVDHTNSLERETELLEAERSDLQTEVQRLQQHVEQLQYILQAHQPLCKHEPKHLHASQDAGSVNGVKVKQEPGTNGCQTNGGHQRPGSLPLLIKKESGDDSCGVPISTPSSGIFSLGFDSLVDGSTGLTPVTSGPSCGSQAQRNNSEGSTSSGGSTTLISL